MSVVAALLCSWADQRRDCRWLLGVLLADAGMTIEGLLPCGFGECAPDFGGGLEEGGFVGDGACGGQGFGPGW